MKAKRLVTSLLGVLMLAGVSAQNRDLRVKIVDLQDVKTIVTNVSTSSSSSCNTSDFPVYQGSTQANVNFADLKSIIVRQDVPAEDVNNYITVELIFRNGKSGLYEIVKNIRFTGDSESGKFSIKVKDVNMVEVLEKYY